MKPPVRLAIATLALPLLAIACGPDAGIVDPVVRDDDATAAQAVVSFGEWSPPMNLGPVVNSPFHDVAPELSRDGLSLYFASARPPATLNDIYVARRATTEDPWGPPVRLAEPINSPFGDAGPFVSRDGHELFFTSARRTGQAGNDIYVAWRADVHDDFAWGEPLLLAGEVNTDSSELAPSLWGPELYFWRGPPTAQSLPGDIFVSERHGNVFGKARRLDEVSSASHDESPTVRYDGREMYIASDRPGSLGANDLWVSYREPGGRAWSTPVNVGPVINTTATERKPTLSRDGTILLFYSTRPGGHGLSDLYMSTRTRSDAQD